MEWLTFLKRFLRSDSPSWRDRLHAIAAELSEIASSTEGDFLMIGGSLRDFSVRTRELSQLSSAIAERMAGAKMKEAMEGLQETFSRVRRLDGESGLGRDVLTTILENFGCVQTHLLFFEGTVRQLHALCSFIRIENARSGRVDTGFDTLADDVMVLARNIRSQSARLLDQVTVLTNLIGNNLEKIRHFDDQQHRNARHILDDSVNNLSALREKYANSTEAMKAFSLHWNRLSSNIGEVVSAMQFHDITRQRIEHVSEALADLAVPGAAPARRRVFPLRPAHLQSDSGGIAAACELQAAQLSHARDEFVSAVQAIIENIHDIADNVEEISEETRQLAGAADDEGNSFLTTLDAGLASLTSAISNYESANDELTAALGRTVEMVEQMSELVSQIEKIGIEMRIIAINASIHAAHIGEEGLALGVLADALRPLSLETSGRSAPSPARSCRSLAFPVNFRTNSAATRRSKSAIPAGWRIVWRRRWSYSAVWTRITFRSWSASEGRSKRSWPTSAQSSRRSTSTRGSTKPSTGSMRFWPAL